MQGVDDFASIREVITRRIQGLQERDEPFPDILLIDGGKGQLGAALAAFEVLKVDPPTVISLAKREEEIYVPGRSDPIVLRRRSFALRLLSTSATRPTGSPSIITTCLEPRRLSEKRVDSSLNVSTALGATDKVHAYPGFPRWSYH